MSTIPIFMAPPKGIVLTPNGGDPYFEQVSLLYSPEVIANTPYVAPNWGYATLNQPYFYGGNQSSTIATPTTGMAWMPAVLSSTGGSTFTNMYTASHAGYNLGGVDFTIEGWFRYTTAMPSNTQIIFSIKDSATGSSISLRRKLNANNTLQWSTPDGTSADMVAGAVNIWNYFAITRSGSTTKIWINGVLRNTATGTTWATSFTNAGSHFIFGSYATGANPDTFAGQIGEIRITKGTARYTASGDITLPTEAFPKWKDGYPKPTNRPVGSPNSIGSSTGTTTITPSTWIGTPTITAKWQKTSTLYASFLWADLAHTGLTSPLPAERNTMVRYIETATIGTLTTINYSNHVTAGWSVG